MHVDNRLADRQPQPNARNGGFLITARKFFEYGALLTGRNTRPVIPDVEPQHTFIHPGSNPQPGLCPGVFSGIFQKINQHALKQRAIHMD